MGGFSDIYKNTGRDRRLYESDARRWNWGVSGGQVPYLSGGYASGMTTVNGQPAFVEQEIIYRQTYRGVNGTVAYPFSLVHRIELGARLPAGVVRSASPDDRGTTPEPARLLSNTTETTAARRHPASRDDDRARASTIRPSLARRARCRGSASRFELTPTFGSLSYIGALADYRRYFMPARFYTIAGRVMHYGRYGRDGENPHVAAACISDIRN